MDNPGILVSLLGLGLIFVGSWLVVACQRAALVRAERDAERRGRERAERLLVVRRGSLVRLAEVARAGWRDDGAFTARGDGAGQAAGVGFGGASVASTTSTTAMPCG